MISGHMARPLRVALHPHSRSQFHGHGPHQVARRRSGPSPILKWYPRFREWHRPAAMWSPSPRRCHPNRRPSRPSHTASGTQLASATTASRKDWRASQPLCMMGGRRTVNAMIASSNDRSSSHEPPTSRKARAPALVWSLSGWPALWPLWGHCGAVILDWRALRALIPGLTCWYALNTAWLNFCWMQ